MKFIYHPANERGFTEWSWLKSAHSFSFGQFHQPDKVNFGRLRVLNDDIVQPGSGFDLHAHQNMEIISIPLAGSLLHKDSTGTEATISPGEVQVMTAGRGIYHSEYNASETEDVQFLQIWILPQKTGLAPRYEQKRFPQELIPGELQPLVSPDGDGETLIINQDAYISKLKLGNNDHFQYQVHNANNGVYIFLLEGSIIAGTQPVGKRDAVGIWDQNSIDIKSREAATILFIEIPIA